MVKLVLTLHAQEKTAASASVPKTVAASTTPAGKSMSPFAARVVDTKTDTKAEAQTELTAKAQPVAASAATPVTSEKPEAASASTSDFVFVEPTYEAKATVADPAADPTERAQDAAAKFSDKTAAELLPVKMNAAQASQSTGSSTGSAGIQPAVNLASEQKEQAGQQPAAVGPRYTGEPISVNLKDVDLKDFFRLIHEISGLNVVLDPNVHGTLTIVLDDVPWDQALDIVLKNNDLARELEGNVLRVATVDTLKKEADGRRAQVESEALAVEKVSVTRFLSYAHAKDVMLTVKKFLSARGDVVADERTNAIIVNDIPKVIPIIDRLLTQLDRKTQEVEIEARVVAATRTVRARHRHAAWLRLGQWPQRDRRRFCSRRLADDSQQSDSGLHYGAGYRFDQRKLDSSVLKPGLDRAHQRLDILERQQHGAHRCRAFDG